MEEYCDKIRDENYLQSMNYKRMTLKKKKLLRNNIILEEMMKYGIGDNMDGKTWKYYYGKMYNSECPFELVNYLYNSIIFDPDIYFILRFFLQEDKLKYEFKLDKPSDCSLVRNARAIPFLIDILDKKHFIVIWINYNTNIIDIYDPAQPCKKIYNIIFNNIKKYFTNHTLVYIDDYKVQKDGSNDKLCMWYGIYYALKRYQGYSHYEASNFIYSNINLVKDEIFNLMYQFSQLALWSCKQ